MLWRPLQNAHDNRQVDRGLLRRWGSLFLALFAVVAVVLVIHAVGRWL